jgi:preprotein translocase subunit SecA
MVTKAIANAQKKVEGHNFDIRKHLLEYDDVMNAQREIIYDQRKMIFEGDELHETILDMVLHVMEDDLALYANETLQPEEWEFESLKEILGKHFALHVGLDKNKNLTIENKTFDFETITHQALLEFLTENCHIQIDRKKRMVGDEMWSEIERYITLNIVDGNWKDHLLSMDYLKEGVGLRGYAQKNPLHEYKKEGMALFNEMMVRIREDVVSALCHVKVESQEEGRLREQQMAERQKEQASMVESLGDRPQKKEPVKRSDKKVGRNDPCPCGSGKKYKKCHGAN